MANNRYLVTHLDDTPTGGPARVSMYIADTDAGKPSSGLNVGDLCVTLDSPQRLYIATGATTWIEIGRTDRDNTWTGTNTFNGIITVNSGADFASIPTFLQSASFVGELTLNLQGKIVHGQKALLSGGTTNLLDIAISTVQSSGGHLYYSVEADNGTDVIIRTGQLAWSALNKAGVYSTSAQAIGTETLARSDVTDTLVNTFDFTTGTNKVLLRLTPTLTGMTATMFRVNYMTWAGTSNNVTIP
jgi:hypothetical protein